MNEVKVKKCIVCTKTRKGDGKTDMVRIITEVFDLKGKLIAEYDPCGGYTVKDMIDFATHFKSLVNEPGYPIIEVLRFWDHKGTSGITKDRLLNNLKKELL